MEHDLLQALGLRVINILKCVGNKLLIAIIQAF